MYDRTEDRVRGTQNDPRFAGAVAAEALQSEVPHALNRLEAATSELHETIKVLHERLAPVRNEHSKHSDIEGDQEVRGYSSEVARRIGNQADGAELATNVLLKILNELEV